MTENEAIERLQTLNIVLTDKAGHEEEGIEKIFTFSDITAICDLCYLGSPCEYQNPEISCEKCIEYDTEEHCCPKFCKVITDTIQEMKEEHHNNDFCEWTEISVGGITAVKEPHGMKLLNHDREQQFCPYCGKKIKIAPYQPKGE